MTVDPAVARPRVVLVDDTEDLRQLLRIALRRAGYDVVGEAGDGQAGVAAVREHLPDLVMLDLSMPVMDGLEALPLIRGCCPDATIVVLSGFGATQMAERAMTRGADGYIQKGASLSSIIEHVGGLLERRAGGTAPAAQAVRPLHGAPADPVPARGLLDLAPVGVIELVAGQPGLVVRYANAAARQLLGHPLPLGTDVAAASAELASAVAARRIDPEASFDVSLETAGLQASLRRSDGSMFVYLDSAAEDVAVLRRAIAVTAHEIRGPVAVICGTAETIDWAGDDDLDREQLAQMAEAMARQARILDGITTDLLTAAQIQRGTLWLDLQDVSVATVVAALARRYGAAVRVTDDPTVRADPRRLEQMLTNLLTNAQKYGRPPLEVRVRPAGALVDIDVVDRGDGVPPGFREQLFREFTRAESAVATGTGLGLYVVRTLAEAQGGGVRYAPGGEGGAVFTISLPAG